MRAGRYGVWSQRIARLGRKRHRRKDYTRERYCHSGCAKRVNALAARERQYNCKRRIAGRNRPDDTHHANLEGMIKRKRSGYIQQSCNHRERPRLPAGRDVRKRAVKLQIYTQREKAEELHEEQRAIRAHSAGREARSKIRHAPAHGSGQSEDDAQRILRYGRLFAFRLQTEDGHYFLQILPDFALRVRISKQISRMVCGDKFRAAEIEPLAAEAGNALGCLQQRLGGAASQAANHFRANHINLSKKEWRASRDFIFLRQAIFRRAAFHHVADVNILAAQPHRFDHLREQFPRAADEGLAFDVFIAAGTLADENHLRFHAAHSENDIRAAFVQLAASAVANGFSDETESVAFDSIASFKEGRLLR